MENIIKTVNEIKHNKTYILFGCTGSRDRSKRPIMMQLALNNSSFVFVTSDDLHEEKFEDIVKDMLENNSQKHYLVEKDRGVAIKMAISKMSNDDILLILGKGHEEVIIIGNSRIPFNDKKEVLNVIQEKVVIN